MDELINKIKKAAKHINDGESFKGIFNSKDMISIILAIDRVVSTTLDTGIQPYVDEGLINPMTCRYISDHVWISPVNHIINLPDDAKMFTVCCVEYVDGSTEPVVLIKGKTKWLELI
jgi:hypothetical protein